MTQRSPTMGAGKTTAIDDGDLARLRAFAMIVADLDRNFEGRHQGDVSSGDPTGVSQGNPLLGGEGTHIGYTMSGDRIVVPSRACTHDPAAWIVKR